MTLVSFRGLGQPLDDGGPARQAGRSPFYDDAAWVTGPDGRGRWERLPGRRTYTTGGQGATLCAVPASRFCRFGQVVAFRLPGGLSLSQVMDAVGIQPGTPDATDELVRRIETRARELTLPDGAAVTGRPATIRHAWTDPLSAVAVLTKASNTVWLRDKYPLLTVLQNRTAISLIVPSSRVDAVQGVAR